MSHILSLFNFTFRVVCQGNQCQAASCAQWQKTQDSVDSADSMAASSRGVWNDTMLVVLVLVLSWGLHLMQIASESMPVNCDIGSRCADDISILVPMQVQQNMFLLFCLGVCAKHIDPYVHRALGDRN